MQRHATKLSAVEQLALLPEAKVVSKPVSFDRIYTLDSVHDALLYGCELARLAPKQVYEPMGLDKSRWSRIVSGELDFPAASIRKFCNVVNNDAMSLYVAHDTGWDIAAMRKSMDDKDRRIFELEKSNAEKDKALEVAAMLISGRVPR